MRVNIIYYITIRDDLSLLSTLSRVTDEDYYSSWTLEKRRRGEASPSSHVQDRSFSDAKAPGDKIPTAGLCCCINSFSSPFQLVALSVSYFFFPFPFSYSVVRGDDGRYWSARSCWWVCKTLIIIFRLLLVFFWIRMFVPIWICWVESLWTSTDEKSKLLIGDVRRSNPMENQWMWLIRITF